MNEIVLCLVAQSCPTLSTPWTARLLSMEILQARISFLKFLKLKFLNFNSPGLPCPPPGDLPNQGIKPRSPTLQAESLLTEP